MSPQKSDVADLGWSLNIYFFKLPDDFDDQRSSGTSLRLQVV